MKQKLQFDKQNRKIILHEYKKYMASEYNFQYSLFPKIHFKQTKHPQILRLEASTELLKEFLQDFFQE